MESQLGEEGHQGLEDGSEDGGGGKKAEGAADEDEGARQPVEEVRLAEGGEAEIDDQGQDPEGKGAGEHQRHDGKKSRKQRQDQYRRAARRLREERDFALQQNFEIMQRLAALEGSALETRLLTIDGRLTEYQNDADQALSLESQALTQGDSEALRQARLIREQALSRASVLKTEKDRLQQAITQRASQPQRPKQQPLPGQAEINQLAARFSADKPWLKFSQEGPANRETAVLHAIDLAMQAEGRFHASEPEYWSELDRRGRAALPHLFGEGEGGDLEDELDTTVQQTQQRQAPTQKAAPQAEKRVAKGPAVAGSGRQANAGATTKRLSAERVQALRDLGLWGPGLSAADKKEQAEYIKYFDQHDRDNGVN